MKIINYLSAFVILCIFLATDDALASVPQLSKTEKIHHKKCHLTLSYPKKIGKPSITFIDPQLLDSFFPSHKNLKHLSPVCLFEFTKSILYTGKSEIIVHFSYTATKYRPRIYVWNEGEKKWDFQKTLMNRQTLTAETNMQTTRAVVAVFADETNEYEGLASWYHHKRYPGGSATNVFPLGTKLRVTNTKTGKSTTVTVTSTWTQQDPRRAIDLVSTAFKQIGSLRIGLIPVRIEKIP